MSARLEAGAIRVRRAGPADAAILAAIHAGSFAKPWSADELMPFLAAPDCLCFTAPNEPGMAPQGFLIARRTGEEAELLTLAVLPAYRRGGLGRALIEACVAALREAGARQLFLEVDEAKIPARGLYVSIGAVPVGRRRRYYEHGADAAIFCLAL
jgi:ribosomal-protein-alanine N-acetyltransferase